MYLSYSSTSAGTFGPAMRCHHDFGPGHLKEIPACTWWWVKFITQGSNHILTTKKHRMPEQLSNDRQRIYAGDTDIPVRHTEAHSYWIVSALSPRRFLVVPSMISNSSSEHDNACWRASSLDLSFSPDCFIAAGFLLRTTRRRKVKLAMIQDVVSYQKAASPALPAWTTSRFKPDSGKRRRDNKESRLAGLFGSCLAATADKTATETSGGKLYFSKTDLMSENSPTLDLGRLDVEAALEDSALDFGSETPADTIAGEQPSSFFFRWVDVLGSVGKVWVGAPLVGRAFKNLPTRDLILSALGSWCNVLSDVCGSLLFGRSELSSLEASWRSIESSSIWNTKAIIYWDTDHERVSYKGGRSYLRSGERQAMRCDYAVMHMYWGAYLARAAWMKHIYQSLFLFIT